MNRDHKVLGGARARQQWIYAGLALTTIMLGLLLRLVPAGLPFWLVKWGGSVLWAAMVYWIVAALLMRSGGLAVGLWAAGIAAAVELSRLIHTPDFDAFRMTRAGALLLGRVFSGWHFVAYWAAIALTAAVDARFLRRDKGKNACGSGQSLRNKQP